MDLKKICKALEILRWCGVGVGFYFAFAQGNDPVAQLHILTVWLGVVLVGLTGFESVVLGRTAAEITGYVGGRGYQRQSGMNNLAVAITAAIVYAFNWGVHADAAVMTLILVFFALSASNHAYSFFKEGNRGLRNILRPVLTIALIAGALPILIRALR